MLEPAATGMLLKPGVAFLWLFNLLARCQLLHREEVIRYQMTSGPPKDAGSTKPLSWLLAYQPAVSGLAAW